MAKGKKKAIDESSSFSDDEDEGLFGEFPEEKVTAGAKKGRRDRGPFGGGDLVRFQGESSSESEAVFREAPAVPKASNQLKLMQYAKRTPGRLASRLLLKMQVEGAQGAAGANPADLGELTPPAAVHYFHTMIVPQLGQRLNLRAHREMRTLCTALDLLARKLPAHAADLLGQRLKAIEKSCHDGHWQAAGAGLGRSPAKGRRGVHEQGTPPGAQAEGLQPPERGRGRKRKSREGRPKRERERKRQRRRKGEREEGLADEAVTSGPACPPETADAGGLKVFRSVERSPVELFGALWRAFEGKDTPLCRLAQLGKSRGALLEDKSSKQVRGDELLPINPQAVLAYLHSSGEMKAQSRKGMADGWRMSL